MSETPPHDLVDQSSSSSSEDEAWATAYESEFDMTLSDIDEDLLEAMRNFGMQDNAPPAIIGASIDCKCQSVTDWVLQMGTVLHRTTIRAMR